MMTGVRLHGGSMNTWSARFDSIEQAPISVDLPLEWLYLYVNDEFGDLPDLSHLSNVTSLDACDHADDLSARGKIFLLQSVMNGIVFILDDDFIYPPDNAPRNRSLLQKMGGHRGIPSPWRRSAVDYRRPLQYLAEQGSP